MLVVVIETYRMMFAIGLGVERCFELRERDVTAGTLRELEPLS